MPMQYSPVTDSYTTYENVETPKVKISFPLLDDDGLDITDFSTGITEKGTPIIKGQTLPRMTDIKETDSSTTQHSNPSTKSYTFNDSIQDRRKEAFEFFKSRGLSDIHAAGIVGALCGESGKQLNPNAKNPVSGAYGIAQWLGPRRKALFSKYGNNPTFNQQLEFILEELNGPEKRALDDLLSTTSIADATRSFTSMFERPSKKEIESSIKMRISSGEELLKK